MQKLLVVIVAIASLAAGWPKLLKAQEVIGVSVAPVIIEENVNPGEIFRNEITATNRSNRTQTFYVIKRDIKGLTEDGLPIFVEVGESSIYGLSDWIKTAQEPIILLPEESKVIPFTVNIPSDATAGGHFGALFISQTPVRPEETGIGIGFQVATILNLRIAGEVRENAQIREFRTTERVYTRPKAHFIVRVENEGNVALRPAGPIEIYDMFGEKIATLLINENAAAVLPNSVRQFEAEWNGEKFTFGRQRVILSLLYGEDGRKTISAETSFWIFPLKPVLAVIGSVLALTLIIIGSVRIYVRKKIAGLRHHPILVFRPKESNVRLSRGGALALILILIILSFLVVLFFLFV